MQGRGGPGRTPPPGAGRKEAAIHGRGGRAAGELRYAAHKGTLSGLHGEFLRPGPGRPGPGSRRSRPGPAAWPGDPGQAPYSPWAAPSSVVRGSTPCSSERGPRRSSSSFTWEFVRRGSRSRFLYLSLGLKRPGDAHARCDFRGLGSAARAPRPAPGRAALRLQGHHRPSMSSRRPPPRLFCSPRCDQRPGPGLGLRK